MELIHKNIPVEGGPMPLPDSKKCPDCGEQKAASGFYTVRRRDGRERLTAYCKPCHTQRTRSVQRSSQGGWEEVSLQREVAKQVHSLDSAQNMGQPWSQDEHEVLMQDGITGRAAAELLGRSYYAVNAERFRMRKRGAAARG